MSAGTLPGMQPSRAYPPEDGAGPVLTAASRPEPATLGGVEELCQQFVLVCESAVDPLEICSALEFEGLNDQLARSRYGVADVFVLAEEMYRRVPRRPAEPEPLPDPWQVSKFRPALHGLLYGLPTICFPAAAGLLTGPGVLNVLVVALLTSWSLSQGLAYLGYLRLGQADPVQAQRVLVAGMGVGMVGVILAMVAVTLVMPTRVTPLLFGVGLGAYMLGATVLLVLGAERLLFLVLAPGVLGAAAYMALGQPPHLEHAAWAALAATPLLALALALARTSEAAGLRGRDKHAPTGQAAGGKLITLADLRGALPSAGFGLVAGALLVFPVTAGMPGRGGANTGALLASLPLALSMGAAEWTLIWFRRRTQRLLRNTRELRAFAARARLVLLAALLQYLTAALVLTAVVAAVATETRLIHPHPAALPQIAAYMALGGAMFLALLLQAFGSRVFPLVACAVALAFEILYRSFAVYGEIVACTELLIVLAGYAAFVLGRAVRHA